MKKTNKGFTLLEMVVSMAIYAVVLVLISTLVISFSNLYELTDDKLYPIQDILKVKERLDLIIYSSESATYDTELYIDEKLFQFKENKIYLDEELILETTFIQDIIIIRLEHEIKFQIYY